MSFDVDDIASAIALGFFLMHKIVKEEGKLREPTDNEIGFGLRVFMEKKFKRVHERLSKETQDKIH